MYALVIVTCLMSSVVAEDDFGGYSDCSLVIPMEGLFATQLECHTARDETAALGSEPGYSVFLFCIGE